MAGSGRDYLIYFSDDGTSTGVKTEVEFQGDLTLNEGRTATRTAFKNGTRSRHGREGFTASFQIAPLEPLGAGQQLLMDAYDSETTVHVWIETLTPGGFTWEGEVKVAMGDWPLNTDGEFVVSVDLVEDGNITRGTVA